MRPAREVSAAAKELFTPVKRGGVALHHPPGGAIASSFAGRSWHAPPFGPPVETAARGAAVVRTRLHTRTWCSKQRHAANSRHILTCTTPLVTKGLKGKKSHSIKNGRRVQRSTPGAAT